MKRQRVGEETARSRAMREEAGGDVGVVMVVVGSEEGEEEVVVEVRSSVSVVMMCLA